MLLFDCRAYSRLSSSGELDDAPWTTRAVARMHLWMCPPCRRYARQLRLIAEGLRRCAAGALDAEAVAAFKRRLRSQLQ